MDYDKQFEDDIEKATALSLETLALDQFRRNKLQYSSISDVSTATSILKSTCTSSNPNAESNLPIQIEININFSFVVDFVSAYNTLAIHRPRPGSNGNSSTTYASSSLPNSASNGSLAPPPIVPPRNLRTGSSRDEPDLISFTAESSSARTAALTTEALVTDSQHANLMQMVNEMHRQNVNVTGNTYGFAATQPGMQLVPYAGNLTAPSTTAQQQPTKMPLTSDQLTKLYSMGTYGRSPSVPLSSFNQFGFHTASIQHATGAMSAFAPSTFPMNSTTSNVAAATSATSYLHQTTAMFASPVPTAAAASPFPDPSIGAVYSPQNMAAAISRTQLTGAFSTAFGANVMSPIESSLATIATAPKLPPRQISQVSASTIGEIAQSKPAKKDSSSVIHRRTSNVSKQLGDDLIDLDHGIVDK